MNVHSEGTIPGSAVAGENARARINKHSEGTIPGNAVFNAKDDVVGDDSCDGFWVAKPGDVLKVLYLPRSTVRRASSHRKHATNSCYAQVDQHSEGIIPGNVIVEEDGEDARTDEHSEGIIPGNVVVDAESECGGWGIDPCNGFEAMMV
jgi:hypothetical protein